ncbi:MAG: hypothetical protein H7287_01985 [Thermoleophilia bacterium]|nr:hypothetical protein [Thermoleophilia bacterium]
MSTRPRSHTFAQLLLLLTLAAVAAVGCGGDGGADSTGVMQSGDTTESTPSRGGSGDATAPSGKVQAIAATLQVKLTSVGSKTGGGIPVPAALKCTKSIPATCTGTVNCTDGDGLLATGVKTAPGDELSGPELCRWIAETPTSVLTQPAKDAGQVCTQVYGGPETATVSGMRDTEMIDVSFSRTNGCEIARWDAASPLWTGEVPAATDGAPRSIEPEVITDPIR